MQLLLLLDRSWADKSFLPQRTVDHLKEDGEERKDSVKIQHSSENDKKNYIWIFVFTSQTWSRMQSFAAACSSPLWPLRAAEGQRETEIALQRSQHDALGSASQQQQQQPVRYIAACSLDLHGDLLKPVSCFDTVAAPFVLNKNINIKPQISRGRSKTDERVDSFLSTRWIRSHASCSTS